jgi:hypothetical protein
MRTRALVVTPLLYMSNAGGDCGGAIRAAQLQDREGWSARVYGKIVV